jgi:hypothetical protein
MSYTNLSPDSLAVIRRRILSGDNSMMVRSAPAPLAPGPASSGMEQYYAPAIGAVVLGAAGYFLVPKHRGMAAGAGALVGALGGYLAFPASASAATPAGPGPSKF